MPRWRLFVQNPWVSNESHRGGQSNSLKVPWVERDKHHREIGTQFHKPSDWLWSIAY